VHSSQPTSNNGARPLHFQARLNTNCDGFLDALELLACFIILPTAFEITVVYP
jgi:hypothetical protein